MKKGKMPSYEEYCKLLLKKDKKDAPKKGSHDKAGNVIRGRR